MNRLQQLREAAGMSRADLSRRSDVTVDVIEQLEAGENITEAEPALIIPGETTVQDRAVLLNHLADALNGELIARGMSVTADELLQPANDNLPISAEAYAEPGEETLPSIPLIGVNLPKPEELPAEAKSHNITEQPDDIDAALDQLAKNAQVTASEEAARVQPEPEPVSTASSVAQTEDLSASERFAESPQAVTRPGVPPTPTPPPTPLMAVTTAEPVLAQETATPEIPETVAKPEMPETTSQPEITTSVPTSAPDAYEPVPGPDMPGPAPAPEITSEAEPEPPVSAISLAEPAKEVEPVTEVNDIEPAKPASEVTTTSSVVESQPETYETTANLGMTTGDEIGEIIPEPPSLPPVPPTPAPIEAKQPEKPVADVAPLTSTPAPDQPPVMKPYVSPQPTEAAKSRYKLPTGTVVTTMAGIGAAVIYYVWRSWRRSKAESERVAPYYRKK